MGAFEYSFQEVVRCNMCGSPSDRHKVLGKRLNRRQGLFPARKSGITTSVLRCDGCGLIYANPVPVPTSVAQHYGVPPEHYWKDDYFHPDESYLRAQIDRFEALAGQPIEGRSLRALDIGAGIGKGMLALARAGFVTCGIEPSESFCARAVDRMSVPKDALYVTTVEDAEFPENSFDFINMGAVLEHLYDPSRAVEKAMRWLKPGGLVHIEVPSASYLMSTLARLFYRATGCDYVTNLSPMHPPYHLYEFSLKSFRRHGRDHGYRVAWYEHYVCESYMPRVVRPLFHLAMKLSRTGMQLAVWLRRA